MLASQVASCTRASYRPRLSGWWIAALPAAVVGSLLVAAAGHAADRLILRNLEILSDRTVTAFDEDGIVLDRPREGGGMITWDEIERGRVALDQPRFDALLAELGPPLYRVRQRLKIGDYVAASDPAEALYPRFAGRQSQTAYLVCQATMWSRLACGQREAAVEPLLRCAELLRSRSADSAQLPGTRRLQFDAQSATSPELIPIWFDPLAAKTALAGVQATLRSLPSPRPAAAYIYYASLAIAAGNFEEAEKALPLVAGESADVSQWRDILLAQQEFASDSPGDAVQQLQFGLNEIQGDCRSAALFVVGLSLVRSPAEDEQREGILALLTLPAAYGGRQPELAAAGLYHAAQSLVKLKDTTGATAVQRELTHHYASTHFGGRLRAEQR